jgi:hypothetical protein
MIEQMTFDGGGRGGRGKRGKGLTALDKQLRISRTIHGHSGSVLDMTPREVMLAAMHHNMQLAVDWKEHLLKLSEQEEPDEKELAEIETAEQNVSLHLDKAAGHAAQVAPFIHPRFSAVASIGTGDSKDDVLKALLDEVDDLQRAAPKLVEHVPKRSFDGPLEQKLDQPVMPAHPPKE